MALLFWLAAAAVPFLLGKGALVLLYGRKGKRELTNVDALIVGALSCLGIAEAAHLAGVLLGLSFSVCVRVFAVITALGCLLGLLAENGRRRRERNDAVARRQKEKQRLRGNTATLTAGQQIIFIVFGISVLLQVIYLVAGTQTYRAGDMTVETVNTFLAADGIYTVNPLTGLAYELGIPLRLKILSLPTFYGILCSLFDLPAGILVYHMAPVTVLLGGYLVYGKLARLLFADSPEKRGVFLLLVSLLFWLGTYRYGMDGFGALFCGYRGVSIRGAVLLPYTVLACLKKDYRAIVLCVLAEACIVWTFYGLGYCLLTAALMTAARLGMDKLGQDKAAGKEAAKWRNS